MTNILEELAAAEESNKNNGMSGANTGSSQPPSPINPEPARGNFGQTSGGTPSVPSSNPTSATFSSQPTVTSSSGSTTTSNRPGNAGGFQNNQPFPKQNQTPQGSSTNAQKNPETKSTFGDSTFAKPQAKQDQPKKSSNGKNNDKKGSSGKGWVAWVILALVVVGGLLWIKNKNVPKNDVTMKNEQVADVLNNVGSNSTTTSSSTANLFNPSISNESLGTDQGQQGSSTGVPPTPSALTPQQTSGAENSPKTITTYRDPVAAQIGTRLNDLRNQLVQLQATYETQVTIADKTNTALENFKQELLGLENGGSLEAQQANISEVQGNMASLQGAAEFANLENARTLSLLSDIKTKLDDLGKLVAAYNAGAYSSVNI